MIRSLKDNSLVKGSWINCIVQDLKSIPYLQVKTNKNQKEKKTNKKNQCGCAEIVNMSGQPKF